VGPVADSARVRVGLNQRLLMGDHDLIIRTSAAPRGLAALLVIARACPPGDGHRSRCRSARKSPIVLRGRPRRWRDPQRGDTPKHQLPAGYASRRPKTTGKRRRRAIIRDDLSLWFRRAGLKNARHQRRRHCPTGRAPSCLLWTVQSDCATPPICRPMPPSSIPGHLTSTAGPSGGQL
jgi:hypothetical protein